MPVVDMSQVSLEVEGNHIDWTLMHCLGLLKLLSVGNEGSEELPRFLGIEV